MCGFQASSGDLYTQTLSRLHGLLRRLEHFCADRERNIINPIHIGRFGHTKIAAQKPSRTHGRRNSKPNGNLSTHTLCMRLFQKSLHLRHSTVRSASIKNGMGKTCESNLLTFSPFKLYILHGGAAGFVYFD